MNKLIDLKNELVVAVNKNTLRYNNYVLTPMIQQVYPAVSPSSSICGPSNSQTTQTPTMQTQIFYQLTGPNNTNVHFTDEQLEAVAKFIDMLNYKEDFSNTIKS